MLKHSRDQEFQGLKPLRHHKSLVLLICITYPMLGALAAAGAVVGAIAVEGPGAGAGAGKRSVTRIAAMLGSTSVGVDTGSI